MSSIAGSVGQVRLDGGYAAVDALVALMILATTIVLALQAVSTARHASLSALEIREATQTLRYLIDSGPTAPGSISGAQPHFVWRVDTTPISMPGLPPGARLCARVASVVSTASHHRYQLASQQFCPPPA